MEKYKIAVINARSRVGMEILEILSERNFPTENIIAVDVADFKDASINYDEDISVEFKHIDKFDFAKVDIALFASHFENYQQFVEKAAAKGVFVVDNGGFYKHDPMVPLIIPEVNIEDFSMYQNKGIVANPTCTAIEVVMAVAMLHKRYGVKRIVASSYQSVSGKGNDALSELFNQTKGIFLNDAITKTKKVFTKQIAFNVIPHIGDFLEDGTTKEEMALSDETKRILDSTIEVSATCVRVPVFVGHAVALNVELDSSFKEEEALEILRSSKGVSVIDYRANEGYVTPIEAAGEDKVYISRIRKDNTTTNALSMWVVFDNLRKGAALNMIQIVEHFINTNS